MDRHYVANAKATPPPVPAVANLGYPTDGDPLVPTPATEPGEWWFHAVTEEIRAVIVAAGMVPDFSNLSQLSSAIRQLIAQGGIKTPARLATTVNIAALAGGAPNTVDGVALVLNDRVLVKDQTTGSQNGIYVVNTLGTGANGTWARATDADGVGELIAGMLVVVSEGATQADQLWELATDGAITIGTTSLSFVRKDGAASKQIQSITATVAANALTLGLNSTSLDFRASALSSGVVNTRSIGTALTLVVPSGATLGTINASSARLAVLAIDNAGTVELAVSNLSGGVNLDETTLISTTAISVGATSAGVIYSATARANVPFRVVGYIDITETVAGTWASAPTVIQGQGGQALAALSSLGYGQTWQNMTGSRALATTYYNTTGKPICIDAGVTTTGGGSYATFTITVNGVARPTRRMYAPGVNSNSAPVVFIVPAGQSYSIAATPDAGSISLNDWQELR